MAAKIRLNGKGARNKIRSIDMVILLETTAPHVGRAGTADFRHSLAIQVDL
jgi:hypothetical protein